ncbi:MAG: universal stress protein [Flavobacteriales bacterium]|nr:universal stress protein [Flavobacteriales bacterium]
MNKILVPTDFSEHSNYAMEYASFIANEKGGKLIILHIAKELGGADLDKKIEEIKNYSFLSKVEYEIIIEEGHHVSTMINKVGIDQGIDLIVMGSNGISNVGEMLLGSNTENVIRKSRFNVLTIKHKMLDLNIESILFPSNFAPETYSIFETVMEFAKFFDAKIHLLRVNTSNHFEDTASVNEKMDMLIKHFNLDTEYKNYKKAIYDDKNEELGIINYSIDNSLDMIAIGSHGKSVLHKLIHESTSQNLVRDSFRPVLTIRF